MLKSILYTSVALAALTGTTIAQTRQDDENVVVVATRIATPINQVASSVRCPISYATCRG